MKKVMVSRLKARLSHYLRLVRKGESITVYDRDKPVAELIPLRRQPSRLKVTGPAPGAPPLSKVPLPPPLPPEIARAIMDDFFREREMER
jgi:prevent-host-death family protein